jgi:hypothetical protein
MVRDSLSSFISRPPLSSGRSAARIADSFHHFLATDGHPHTAGKLGCCNGCEAA